MVLVQKEIKRVVIRPNGSEVEIRPNLPKIIDYILVGGGGAGASYYGGSGTGYICREGGGGGGGEVLHGSVEIEQNISITIGQGGTYTDRGRPGCASCIGNIVARGGCSGGRTNCSGAASGSGRSGGAGYRNYNSECSKGGGGGGAGGNGLSYAHSSYPGRGGTGLCGYAGGGNGGGTTTNPVCGGGRSGSAATKYGGGGGGGTTGGAGCQGVAIICYKTDGSCGFKCATGGTITTSGEYTVHTFTANGTFTIVS